MLLVLVRKTGKSKEVKKELENSLIDGEKYENEYLKSTMIVKINIVKLVNKYPKLMKSPLLLNILKTYFKGIKEKYKNAAKFK